MGGCVCHAKAWHWAQPPCHSKSLMTGVKKCVLARFAYFLVCS